jgi:hypothetical protein
MINKANEACIDWFAENRSDPNLLPPTAKFMK